MWSMWSSGEPQANVISEAAAAFEEKTGAKVNIEFKGRDVNKVLAASLEAKDNIDIIEDDYKRIGTVYQDFTMDLTDMAKAAGYEEFSYQCFTDQSIAGAASSTPLPSSPTWAASSTTRMPSRRLASPPSPRPGPSSWTCARS